MRSDYLDDLRHEVKDAGRPECAEYHLRPLTPEAAADVVSRSAQAMRLHFPRPRSRSCWRSCARSGTAAGA
ncbi:hypothetical protein ACFQ0B_14380 [Nonomuraea thailandensis]